MLKIEKLSIAYGETQILRDVDLEIGPGQVVCLMGRNGVGKTTLLKGIMGLLRPNSGRILFEGRDLTRARSETRARAGIGYVPQGREIFPHLTVLENLQVGRLTSLSGLELIRSFFRGFKTVLTAKGFSPRMILRYLFGKPEIEVPEYIFDYFPMLKTTLDRPGGVLSGGQQQQLAIARALVAEPKLLILDEPTEGIQPSIITLIGEVLKSLKQSGKVSILLVEQYLEFALKLADRYYVMEKGSIVLQGDSAQKDREAIKPYLAF